MIDRELALVLAGAVTGAAIASITSIVLVFVQYRLSLKTDEIKRKRDQDERVRDDLTHGVKEMTKTNFKKLEGLRSEHDSGEETEFLLTVVSNLQVNIDTGKMLEALNDTGESIQMGQLLRLALDTTKDDVA